MNQKTVKISILGFIGIGLLLGCMTSAYALQVLTSRGNSKLRATISKTELTRIFVNNDRISRVRGKQGTYIIQKDEALGQIYIMPVSHEIALIHLFLTTEKGGNYQLALRPIRAEADSIEIRSLYVSKPEGIKWAKQSAYRQTLIQLMQNMYKGESSKGYMVDIPSSVKRQKLGQVAILELKMLYQGNPLVGRVYRVINKTKKPIQLSETDFYQPRVRAISIEQHRLLPQSTTRLFMVSDHAD